MVRKLKVAIVGCGIGLEHLKDGFLPHADRFEITALCDLREDRLESVGDQYGIVRRTTRFEDLLVMDDVDVIDICTPPTLHFSQAVAALAAGKHVICEKPLVGSLAELDQLEAVAKASPGLLMPIFQYRFGNGVAKAKRLIESGLVGRPYLATAETFWRREQTYYDNPWRGRWRTELGGVLMTQSIHIHDLLTHLMGPVANLYGRVATRVNDIEVEDCASASLEMRSGALVSLSATLGSQDQISRLRLMFEHVTIESSHDPYAPGDDPWTFIPRNEASAKAISGLFKTLPQVASRFETQFALFHDAVTQGTPLPVTIADSRQSLELAAAFYYSAQSGSAVDLPLRQDHPFHAGWVEAFAPSAYAASGTHK